MERVEKIKAAVAAVLQLVAVAGIVAVDSTVMDAVGVAIMAVGALVLAFVEPSPKPPAE